MVGMAGMAAMTPVSPLISPTRTGGASPTGSSSSSSSSSWTRSIFDLSESALRHQIFAALKKQLIKLRRRLCEKDAASNKVVKRSTVAQDEPGENSGLISALCESCLSYSKSPFWKNLEVLKDPRHDDWSKVLHALSPVTPHEFQARVAEWTEKNESNTESPATTLLISLYQSYFTPTNGDDDDDFL